MGLAPSDLDMSTRLLPDETEAALMSAGLRSVPTGKAFGTITAVVDGEPYEITSLREDVETDGRRAVVSYTTVTGRTATRNGATSISTPSIATARSQSLRSYRRWP